MFRGALVFALGLIAVCFPVAAQQTKHSRSAKHQPITSAMPPLDTAENLSMYRASRGKGSSSILFHNGPVRAWSDGAQLVSESAFVQIGMAPLDLFPASYLPANDVGLVATQNPSAAPFHRSATVATNGKDLSTEILSSPLNHVYCTGEVGFVYGRWNGKGNGDYVGSYVWGQAGNDKFQITAGASFENWSGDSPNVRAYRFSR